MLVLGLDALHGFSGVERFEIHMKTGAMQYAYSPPRNTAHMNSNGN